MRKRVISLLLSAVLLLGMVSMTAPTVAAKSEMKVSEPLIDLIKSLEGFAQFPYPDGGQYSVGYGSRVEGQDLVKYQKYGITVAEADALLRVYVNEFEGYVNKFADKYNLTLSQNRFDALVSLTYNVGNSWINNDTNFRKAVINGYTGNDFLYAITQWCMMDSKVSTNLIKRRLSEANIYLNGVYSKNVASNYSYVIFDCSDCSCAVRVQGYNAFLTDSVRPVPGKSGYTFLGWYDSNGKWVTTLDNSTRGKTLVPRWQKDSESVDQDGNVVGQKTNYERYVSAAESLIVRQTPSADAKQTGTLKANQKVTIVAEYVDSQDIKWGKLSTGGWINLSAGTSNEVVVGEAITPVTVTVKQSGVNIRSGPGTNNTKLTTSVKGEKLEIIAIAQGGIYMWGKSEKGWICLDYTNFSEVYKGEQTDEEPVAAGVIVNCSAVNVRKGAGTSNAKIGKIAAGTVINIYETKKVGTQKWARCDEGWVCMDYVELIEKVPEETQKPEEETPDAEKPDQKPEEDKPETSTEVTGSITASSLYIRSGAGTSYKAVGAYKNGDKITILETKSVGTSKWARTEKGWISMKYVKLDNPDAVLPGSGSDSTGNSGSAGTTTPDKNETVKQTGVIINTNQVNVRAKAGVDNAKVGTYLRGDRVNIYETTTCNGAKWARTDKGWVHMFYIKVTVSAPVPETPGTNSPSVDTPSVDTPSTENPPAQPDGGGTGGSGSAQGGVRIGRIVNTSQVNIRKTPSASGTKVGTYTKGTRIVIYETVASNGANWGRTDKGWVHMFYVQLENVKEGIAAGTVTTQLSIRSGPGVNNARVGVYSKGDVVIILEATMVGSTAWGRTDKGWISLAYVK